MKIGSLFTGAGGLDLAVASMWPSAETVWFSEDDSHAAATFQHHHPDIPNLGDIETVDWTTVEPVDVIHGGFPCQDISHAGKGAGIKEGTRSGLWYRFADAIRILRPSLVLLENVAAMAYKNGPLDVVLGSLAAIGFDAEWGLLRASEVGACHQRRRWFLVAWPADADRPRWGKHGGAELVSPQQPSLERIGDDPGKMTLLPTPTVNDMGRGKTLEWWESWIAEMKAKHNNGNGHGKSLAIEALKLLPTPTAVQGRNATSGRKPDARFNSGTTLQDVRYADRWSEYRHAIERWEGIHGAAPSPTDDQRLLSPEFVEWMMGWPQGQTDIGTTSRNQRLKMLGNGVVPHQAAHAYSQLLSRVWSDPEV